MDEIRKYIIQYMDFDSSKGEFRWNGVGSGHRRKKGKLVGSIDSKGYRQIQIFGREYLAHRLVWMMVYGDLPKLHVDHIDRDPRNNSPSNLRLCTHAQNHQNIGLRSTNTSGVTGVSFSKMDKRWLAYINLNGKRHRLGLFEDKDDAIAARLEAKKRLHTFNPSQ